MVIYLEHIFFKKIIIINYYLARERVVGWYSTGPKIKPSDLEINELIRNYTSNPVFVIIDVQMKEVGIPTKAYISVQEVLEVFIFFYVYILIFILIIFK